MCDKNSQEEDNGTESDGHGDCRAIQVAEERPSKCRPEFSTGPELLVQKSNQQRREKET